MDNSPPLAARRGGARTRAAARTVKPKVLFPYRYGETPVQKVADLLDGSGIDVRIRNYQ